MALTENQLVAKSEPKLTGLNPIVAHYARQLIRLSYRAGVPIIISQGLRTIAEQNDIYAQGRTKPGPIVTQVKGGYSFHNFGLAIDFALLVNDKIASWDTFRDGNKDGQRDWLQVAEIGRKLGFEWGGDWSTFIDMPHFQMVFGLTTAQLRAGKKPPTALPKEDPLPTVVKVVYNGKQIAEGQLIDNLTYVKARPVAEYFGSVVGYYANQVTVNGESLTTKNINGTGFVPIREIMATLPNYTFAWDQKNYTVTIAKKA